MISFTETLSIIKQGIQDIYYPEQPSNLYTPISYLLDLKGKKVRPALTLLTYNLYKENIKEALPMALAWEIFHNFTLMHDDVMDNADVRRGQPTVHKKWDENTAILSGDSMLILAYQYALKSPAKDIRALLNLFSKTAMEICEGQQYDMEFEFRSDVTEEEYLKMIRLKTAVMLGGASQSGAMIAEASEKDSQALYDFGINLGLAFQIQDDILDVYGNSSVFGKNIGGDILCGKKTYLLTSAMSLSDKNTRKELIDWLNYKEEGKEKIKIEAVTAIYDKLLIKEKAYSKKESFYEKALQALDEVSVPDNKKEVLRKLAADLMERNS
ncbi:polyprenyl synthetase family protein [Bacteroidales bacterium OttesenSCG-928-M11]|nr:polyprenyl synthetase family protein [Bacteroidales bacterium OttesenSCG-928-M11]